MSRGIAITIADLYNSKVSPLITAADTTALAAGQTGRVAGVIADVTLEIRRKVASANQLDADVTKIPGGLKPLAVDIIFCRLKVALEMDLSEAERDSLKARQRDLDRIANGDDMVDAPDNPISSGQVMQSSNPVQSSAEKRQATRYKMGGLI